MGSGQPLKANWKEPCCICNQITVTKPLLVESDDAYDERESHQQKRHTLNVCFSCFVSPDEDHEWDEDGNYRNLRHRQNIWYAGSWDTPYPLQETLWDIEGLVKYLNQTKNDGRNEVRTIKDKENQKLRDYDLVVYNKNKANAKLLTAKLEDETLSPDTVSTMQNIIKNHKHEMLRIEAKYKKCLGKEYP